MESMKKKDPDHRVRRLLSVKFKEAEVSEADVNEIAAILKKKLKRQFPDAGKIKTKKTYGKLKFGRKDPIEDRAGFHS